MSLFNQKAGCNFKTTLSIVLETIVYSQESGAPCIPQTKNHKLRHSAGFGSGSLTYPCPALAILLSMQIQTGSHPHPTSSTFCDPQTLEVIPGTQSLSAALSLIHQNYTYKKLLPNNVLMLDTFSKTGVFGQRI